MTITIKFVGNSDAILGYGIDAVLPALQGSEKQVAWATEIRANFLRSCGKTFDEQAKARGLAAPLCHWNNADDMAFAAPILAKVQADFAGKPADMFGRAIARTDASFWIDTRNQPIAAILKAAAK